jgi:protein O-GlcNAc transferase
MSASLDALFERAVQLQRQGKAAESDALCIEFLRTQPDDARVLHLRGLLALQAGGVEAGIALIEASLRFNPGQPAAQSNLGNALLSQGRTEAALGCFEAALRLQPDFVAAWLNRGVVLHALGRRSEALDSFDRALAVRADDAVIHKARAPVLLELDRPQDALASYDHALAAVPHDPLLNFGRGTALHRLGRAADALRAFDRALGSRGDFPEALNNRCSVLQDLGRLPEALESCERALALFPGFVEAHINRGNILLRLCRFTAALGSYQQALALQPLSVAALSGAARASSAQGACAQALVLIARALAIEPDQAESLALKAAILSQTGQHEEAAQTYAWLVNKPEFADQALIPLLNARLQCCDWHSLDGLLSRLGSWAEKPQLSGELLAITDCAAAQLRLAHNNVKRAVPVVHTPLCAGVRYRHERIRLAYVSGDLGEHAVSFLLAGVFEAHDRRRFELFAVALREHRNSGFDARVRSAFARVIDVGGESDAEVASVLRELEIDIAVDLQGNTAGGRLPVYAMRPAPVQVNYLGYPGTMGAEFWDYIIADPFVIPAASRRCYAERIAYLPHCFQANDDRRPRPPPRLPRRQLGLPESGLVLACLNASNKITPALFDVWARLLRAAPDAVLWLVESSPTVVRNLRMEAERREVDPARLIFAPRVPYPAHLERLQLADLFLDTLPFNAGATASDALWMGVPLLTCAGEAFAARMSGSLLSAIGLPELITHSLEAYVHLGLELVRDRERLREIKRRLEAQRLTMPLFDTARFCGHLERAYLHMWERAERGQSPETFCVSELDPIVADA